SLPQIIHLPSKTTIVEIPLNAADQPNIFIEAITITDGIIHNVVQMLPIPPEKRQLTVSVDSDKKSYQPGEKVKIKVRVNPNDLNTKISNLAISVYDKSLDAIAPNNNETLAKLVWGSLRYHYQNTFAASSIDSQKLYYQNLPIMPRIAFDYYYPTFHHKRGRNAEMMFTSSAKNSMSAVADMAVNATADNQASQTVRLNFADSAFWQANLQTDANGEASIDFTLPENLTTWKIVVHAVSAGFAVGETQTEITTTKNFITRLHTPRFLVENDQALISATIHNYLPKNQKISTSLQIDKLSIISPQKLFENLTILANSETRLSWLIQAENPGNSEITFLAKSNDVNDGLQQNIPILIHGAEKLQAKCGQLLNHQNNLNFSFHIPQQRNISSTSLTINVSPSLALSMIDAIPFLVKNTNDCAEQTLHRFLPLAIINKMLVDLKIDLPTLAKNHTNLNPQQIGPVRKFNKNNPIFDRETIKKITNENLEKLYQTQNPDGGWSWFFGGKSDPYTTAIILRGLKIANENNIAIIDNVMQNASQFLLNHQNAAIQKRNLPLKNPENVVLLNNLDALIAYVLPFNKKITSQLFLDRANLSNYGKALVALTMHNQPEFNHQMLLLARNINQFVHYDDENHTAFV
ncbi:MAG: alpha-2-macroglobulin family protein, partial [Lentisphaeria bacterium]